MCQMLNLMNSSWMFKIPQKQLCHISDRSSFLEITCLTMWYQEGGRGGGRGGGSRHCKDQKSPELLSRLALQVLPPQNDDDEWLCRCSRHKIYFKLCLFTSYVCDRHIFHNFHYGLFLILVCFRRLHCYLIKIITIQIFQEKCFFPAITRIFV